MLLYLFFQIAVSNQEEDRIFFFFLIFKKCFNKPLGGFLLLQSADKQNPFTTKRQRTRGGLKNFLSNGLLSFAKRIKNTLVYPSRKKNKFLNLLLVIVSVILQCLFAHGIHDA